MKKSLLIVLLHFRCQVHKNFWIRFVTFWQFSKQTEFQWAAKSSNFQHTTFQMILEDEVAMFISYLFIVLVSCASLDRRQDYCCSLWTWWPLDEVCSGRAASACQTKLELKKSFDKVLLLQLTKRRRRPDFYLEWSLELPPKHERIAHFQRSRDYFDCKTKVTWWQWKWNYDEFGHNLVFEDKSLKKTVLASLSRCFDPSCTGKREAPVRVGQIWAWLF